MEVTFLNITVTIKAKSEKAAYTKLCDLLAKGDPNIWWETDAYIKGNDWWDNA